MRRIHLIWRPGRGLHTCNWLEGDVFFSQLTETARWLPLSSVTAELAVTRQLRSKSLAADLLRDAVDGVVGRERRAFLPAYEMRDVVSREIGLALRYVELGIGSIALDVTVIRKGTEGVGNFAPTDVDRLSE